MTAGTWKAEKLKTTNNSLGLERWLGGKTHLPPKPEPELRVDIKARSSRTSIGKAWSGDGVGSYYEVLAGLTETNLPLPSEC